MRFIGAADPHISGGGDRKSAEDDTAQCCGEKRIHVTISFQIRAWPPEEPAPHAGHGRKSYAQLDRAGKTNSPPGPETLSENHPLSHEMHRLNVGFARHSTIGRRPKNCAPPTLASARQ
jgi:hypothetical protein